ncbi:unnamed protein product [Didymodactylos carnosus]|uniref:SP-RING-type domain-containing protein n=1 Tax=Didymodactylos carnosus TaxID=1234261 RepID=A0A814EPB4_9BILA|nr:unnamed protein product [Didymodactylos carnosus]CAF3743384.1 unnamed protein product [Didymodactylos carnosus]
MQEFLPSNGEYYNDAQLRAWNHNNGYYTPHPMFNENVWAQQQMMNAQNQQFSAARMGDTGGGTGTWPANPHSQLGYVQHPSVANPSQMSNGTINGVYSSKMSQNYAATQMTYNAPSSNTVLNQYPPTNYIDPYGMHSSQAAAMHQQRMIQAMSKGSLGPVASYHQTLSKNSRALPYPTNPQVIVMNKRMYSSTALNAMNPTANQYTPQQIQMYPSYDVPNNTNNMQRLARLKQQQAAYQYVQQQEQQQQQMQQQSLSTSTLPSASTTTTVTSQQEQATVPQQVQSNVVVANNQQSSTQPSRMSSSTPDPVSNYIAPTPPATPYNSQHDGKLSANTNNSARREDIRITLPLPNAVVVSPFQVPHDNNSPKENPLEFDLRGDIYNKLKATQDYDIQLKFYSKEDLTQAPFWPNCVSITVNCQPLHPERKYHSLYFKQFCKQGVNQLIITTTGCILKHNFNLNVAADGTFGDGIEPMQTKLPLKCPISLQRIGLPARGRHCTHIQCYDLHSFLILNCERIVWLCPLCTKHLTHDILEVDQSLWSILDNKASEDIDDILMDIHGNWKPLINRMLKYLSHTQQQQYQQHQQYSTIKDESTTNPLYTITNASTPLLNEYNVKTSMKYQQLTPNTSLPTVQSWQMNLPSPYSPSLHQSENISLFSVQQSPLQHQQFTSPVSNPGTPSMLHGTEYSTVPCLSNHHPPGSVNSITDALCPGESNDRRLTPGPPSVGTSKVPYHQNGFPHTPHTPSMMPSTPNPLSAPATPQTAGPRSVAPLPNNILSTTSMSSTEYQTDQTQQSMPTLPNDIQQQQEFHFYDSHPTNNIKLNEPASNQDLTSNATNTEQKDLKTIHSDLDAYFNDTNNFTDDITSDLLDDIDDLAETYLGSSTTTPNITTADDLLINLLCSDDVISSTSTTQS